MNKIQFLLLIGDFTRSIILIYLFYKIMPSRKHMKVLIPIAFMPRTLIYTSKLYFIVSVIQILAMYTIYKSYKDIQKEFLLKVDLDKKIHDKEIMSIYKEMNGWRHDFKNHINMILGLMESGSKEDVIDYLIEMDNSINKLNEKIYTHSIAINSVLISKMKVAKDNNIKVNLDIQVQSEVNISNVDVCIILGNLLDNSIEACKRIYGDRIIDLKIISKDNRLIIKISNNTDGRVNEIKGKFLTTKNKKMNGLGLVQIDNIIKKYGGYINRKHENNIFYTYVMIEYETEIEKGTNLS